MQDGGAASFLGSKPKVVEYLKFLITRGVDPNDSEVYRCNKGFKYGNSQRESTDLCVVMPMFVAEKKIKALCYIIGGNTPILMGRPLIERLGLTVDYDKQVMRWPEGQWQSVPLGPKGEYLVHLAEDLKKFAEEDVRRDPAT